MKFPKCSRYNCNKNAIGYFIGSNYGLLLCAEHRMGKFKMSVKEWKEMMKK